MEKHLLFICSSNVDRSPAAEALFKDSKKYKAKSAGVGPFTENKANLKLIEWTDIIFVMDEKNEMHKSLLLKQVPEALGKEIIILNINNNYCRNDPALLNILQTKLVQWLDENNDYQESSRLLRIKIEKWRD